MHAPGSRERRLRQGPRRKEADLDAWNLRQPLRHPPCVGADSGLLRKQCARIDGHFEHPEKLSAVSSQLSAGISKSMIGVLVVPIQDESMLKGIPFCLELKADS